MDIVALFCDIDDFGLRFEPQGRPRLLPQGSPPRQREATLTRSEGRTMEGGCHQSGSRPFKGFYLRSAPPPLRWAFPRVVSYTRAVELRQAALVPLCAYRQPRKGHSRGLAFMDSPSLAVCHPKRPARPRVFAGLAGWGENASGWC
jgi:hypothetical protein